MDLLRAALHISERIPDTDEYRLEREFCWLAVGRTALVVGDDYVLDSTLGALKEGRPGAEMRMAVVASRSSRRSDIVADFLARLEYWEQYLGRGELSDLAGTFGRHFSVVEIARAVSSIEDRFTRTTMLVQLADGATDNVMKVSLLADARHEAWGVEDGNYDYALKHVVSGYIDAGMFAEAGEAVDAMRNPEIRLDYLAYLSSALEEAGKGDEADRVLSDRAELESVNPDTRPQSELLAEAESLLEMDLDPEFPSNRTRLRTVETDIQDGRFDEAVTAIRQHFPTLFCPASLKLDSDRLRELLLFQIERVHSYHRNDLKVEFLTDLVGTAHGRGAEIPTEVENAISTLKFLRLEPAAVPSVHSVDPSVLEASSSKCCSGGPCRSMTKKNGSSSANGSEIRTCPIPRLW